MFRASALTVVSLILIGLCGAQTVVAEGWLWGPHEMTEQAWREAMAKPESGENWLAIVGDSSVTGVATHTAYKASWADLLVQVLEFGIHSQRYQLQAQIGDYPSPQMFGITDPVAPMTRVLYSSNEFQTAAKLGESGRWQINAEAKASIQLDTPEHSFGYMIGRALKVAPEHIALVGQDGKRFATLSSQFQRIFEVGTPTLPPLILASYVANDFCHPDNFTRPVSEFKAEYAGDVHAALSKIVNLPPAPQGTLILILAPLDVANLLTNPAVLAQEIPFQGIGQVTCGELRKGLPETASRLTLEMQKTLVGECRGVMVPPDDPVKHLQRVRDLQQAQVEVLTSEVAAFNDLGLPGLKAQVGSSIREINFTTGDVAGDCFHPSVSGHARIAEQLLTHELKNWPKSYRP